jgi:cyanophycin synthetase
MSMSITPRLIIAAAHRRGWSVRILDESVALYRLESPDGSYYYLRNIATSKSGNINNFITNQKHLMYQLAQELGLPIPPTMILSDDTKQLDDFFALHKHLVVKPADQGHGDGVTVDITNRQVLEVAIEYAKTFSDIVLVQRHITGEDYRILFIDKRLAAAVIRKPAYVVGNGKDSLAELIEQENRNPNRSHGYNNLLTTIDVEQASRYLGDRINDVIPKGQEEQVMGTSNIGKGGVSKDITDNVPAEMLEICQTLVDHFDIGLCGVDFMVDEDGKVYLIEVNMAPSLGLHENPYEGQAQHTPDKFLDWLAK